MLFIGYKNLTDQDFNIICPWITRSDKKLYKKYQTLHTGVDISGKKAYAYSQGVVLMIGVQGDKYSVTVQFDAENIFRYCDLSSVDPAVGDIVQAGDQIGTAKRHVHFEWATTAEKSDFAAHIGDVTYYKQNPERLFNGEIVLRANDWSTVTENEYGYDDGYDLTPAMQNEFEVDNRDYGNGDV